ncbi:MAG: hypothetical protein J6D54_07590 [Olsenella sp.]|nr:hypothetical protein [Olsenella sp.]
MSFFEELPPLIPVRQLAELTGMHEVTLRKGLREGRIPGDKVDGMWFAFRDLVFPRAKEAFGDGEK